MLSEALQSLTGTELQPARPRLSWYAAPEPTPWLRMLVQTVGRHRLGR